MKTLFLNPSSGIAGDMLVGALLDLGADVPAFWKGLRSLPLGDDEWSASADKVVKSGVTATRFLVECARPRAHGEEHHHAHGRQLAEIVGIIESAAIGATAKERAISVFQLLAEAKGHVHGIAPEKVHFHEVGAVDAIIDIVGACLALDLLEVERLVFAPPALGGGTVRCAHGVLPVPTPAVARLLHDVPTQLGPDVGELTTPTGAALLKALGEHVAEAVPGRILASGYGAGTKDLPDRPNVLQAILIDADAADPRQALAAVDIIECNIDDMPGEHLSHIIPKLLEAGALDVAVVPCLMKKGRQGMIVQVAVPPAQREELAELLLRQTTTFGVRWRREQRLTLAREVRTVDTEFGPIQVKLGYFPGTGELIRLAPEYDSCRRAADESGRPFAEVYNAAHQAAADGCRDGARD